MRVPKAKWPVPKGLIPITASTPRDGPPANLLGARQERVSPSPAFTPTGFPGPSEQAAAECLSRRA